MNNDNNNPFAYPSLYPTSLSLNPSSVSPSPLSPAPPSPSPSSFILSPTSQTPSQPQSTNYNVFLEGLNKFDENNFLPNTPINLNNNVNNNVNNDNNAHNNNDNLFGNNMFENVLETQRAVKQLLEQKKENSINNQPFLASERANNNNNYQNAQILHQQSQQSQQPQSAINENTETNKILNERLFSFLSNVENRLNSLENKLGKLAHEFKQSHGNQQNFNEEFLKAISSLSNDVSSTKSILSAAPGVPSPVVSKNPNFSLSPISVYDEVNKKTQEQADSEIAKQLQDEFDKQQPQQPHPNPHLPIAYPNIPPVGAPATDTCPICQLALPVKDLQSHVESHLDGSGNANPNQSQGQNQPGLLSRLFPAKQQNNEIRPPSYVTPMPGYPMSVPPQNRPILQPPQPQPTARPVMMGPANVGYPQQPQGGSMIYRPPPGMPPGLPPGMVPYVNPNDGSVYYYYPQGAKQ